MPWIDEDGDGLHDTSFETRTEYERRQGSPTPGAEPRDESTIRADLEGEFGDAGFTDGDGDGYDDRTGSSRAVHEQDAARRAARGGQEQDAYLDSGSRASDIDSGRNPRRAPENAGTASVANGGAGRSGGNVDGLSSYTETSADIPVWNWLSNASNEQAAAQAADAESRQSQTWRDLYDFMPTPDDLAVDYERETFIEGPDHSELAGATGDVEAMAAERRALEGFEDIYNSGGLTSADRARMQLGEQEMGRAMRSQRDADMSSLRARGMGGSGAAVQSMLSAQQGGADMLASREAQMQIAAQDRAMQALGSAGDMSSRMRGQGWEEDATRRGALDDYNWRNTDDRRDSQRWNLGRDDKTNESRSNARQESFNNRVTVTSGETGDYQGNQSRRAKEQDDSDENAKDLGGLIAGLLD